MAALRVMLRLQSNFLQLLGHKVTKTAPEALHYYAALRISHPIERFCDAANPVFQARITQINDR